MREIKVFFATSLEGKTIVNALSNHFSNEEYIRTYPWIMITAERNEQFIKPRRFNSQVQFGGDLRGQLGFPPKRF